MVTVADIRAATSGEDVYNSLDGDTVTIDPITRAFWVSGHGERHYYSLQHGRRSDVAAMQRSIQKPMPLQKPRGVPSVREIEQLPKFSQAAWTHDETSHIYLPDSFNGQKRESDRQGKLPVIDLHHAAWSEKGRGDIEIEIREAARLTGARLFGRSDTL